MMSNFKKSVLSNQYASANQRCIKYFNKPLIVFIAYLPFSSSFCYAETSTTDLYQGTISAMQTYNYQPSGNSTGQSINGWWSIQSFVGGLLTSTPMEITAPVGQGTPTTEILASIFVYNCLGNTTASTGTVDISVSVSDSTEISSTTSVTNSSSTFNGDSATVSIGYVPPGPTGGGTITTSNTYSWGQTIDTDTSTGGGTENTSGTSSSYDYTVNYSVDPGYGQYINITDSVTQYSGAAWQSTVSLTGSLSNILYNQLFENSQAAHQTTSDVAGTGYPANIWYPSMTWTSTAGDVLASPSGAYAFIPNWTADLVGFKWAGINSASITYFQGEDYDTAEQGMNLLLLGGACNSPCSGNFWATNTAGTSVAWDSNTSPAYLAMQDDGNLVGYNSADQAIWTSNLKSAVVVPPSSSFAATPSQLLGDNSTAFIATGTYSATTYDSNATIGQTTPAALTASQTSQYCGEPTESGQTREEPQSNYQYAMYEPANNGQIEANSQPNFIKTVYEPSSENKFVRMDNRTVRDLRKNKKSTEFDHRQKQLGKSVKINSPIELGEDQYYAAPLPGLTIAKVVVNSDTPNSYTGIAPGISSLNERSYAGDFKRIKLEVGKHKHFFVETE